MNKNIFFKELINALDLDEVSINEETVLYLDSLSTLNIIAFADKHFNKEVDTTQLTYVFSVKNLMELIGLENFE
jgi:acyl carrier protein